MEDQAIANNLLISWDHSGSPHLAGCWTSDRGVGRETDLRTATVAMVALALYLNRDIVIVHFQILQFAKY